jgi:hypothetical protein
MDILDIGTGSMSVSFLPHSGPHISTPYTILGSVNVITDLPKLRYYSRISREAFAIS